MPAIPPLCPLTWFKHCLDDVRLDADWCLGHSRRNGPADIVDDPVRHIELGVELGFALRPSLKATSTFAEDEIAIGAPGDAPEDVNRGC